MEISGGGEVCVVKVVHEAAVVLISVWNKVDEYIVGWGANLSNLFEALIMRAD